MLEAAEKPLPAFQIHRETGLLRNRKASLSEANIYLGINKVVVRLVQSTIVDACIL